MLAKSLGDDLNDLITFLLELNEQKSYLPDNLRIHLILKIGEHWTNTDVLINQGVLEFYLIDAANSLRHILDEISAIHKYCPNSRISYTGLGTQLDRENCAYFALTIASTSARIAELHVQALPCVNGGKIGDFDNYNHYIHSVINLRPDLMQGLNQEVLVEAVKKIHYIPAANYPKQWGEFLKNNQDFNEIRNKFANKGYFLLDNNSLDNYINRHTEEYQEFPCHPLKKRNKGILVERGTIKKAILQHFNRLDEKKCETVIAERQNLNSLASPRILSAQPQRFFTKATVDMRIEELRSTLDTMQTSGN